MWSGSRRRIDDPLPASFLRYRFRLYRLGGDLRLGPHDVDAAFEVRTIVDADAGLQILIPADSGGGGGGIGSIFGTLFSPKFLPMLAMMIIGALLAGLLSSAIGMRPTLLIGATLGFLFSSTWLLFSPLRQIRRLPTEPVVDQELIALPAVVADA